MQCCLAIARTPCVHICTVLQQHPHDFGVTLPHPTSFDSGFLEASFGFHGAFLQIGSKQEHGLLTSSLRIIIIILTRADAMSSGVFPLRLMALGRAPAARSSRMMSQLTPRRTATWSAVRPAWSVSAMSMILVMLLHAGHWNSPDF